MKKKSVKKTKKKTNSKKIHHKIKEKVKSGQEKVKKTRLGRWYYNLKHEHKVIFGSIIAIILVIILVFGARIYLFLNFILGNDTIVKLTVDQQDFYLKNSQTEEVEFSIYASSNFFCQAECKYTFQDLSNGYILDKNNFSGKLANPNKLKYSIVAPERGEGQRLYHFEVSCKSKKTTLCKTDEEPRRRSLLVALNYELSEEQKDFKERATDSLKELIFQTEEAERIKLENKEMKKILSDAIDLEKIPKDNLSNIEKELDIMLNEWKNYEYEIVLDEEIKKELNKTKQLLININKNLTNKFIFYNNFLFNLNEMRRALTELKEVKNITQEDYEKISSLIIDYNNLVEETNKTFVLEIQNKTLSRIKRDSHETIINLEHISNKTYNYTELKIPMLVNLERPFYSNYSSGRFIQSEEPMCCYKGDCEICCSSNCENDDSKYPIILVHGHSFNNAVSAESSLGDLDSIRLKLTEDGVIDGGYIILKQLEKTGTFQRTNRPIVFATSYYFDIYQGKEESTILPTKGDSLDTYAVRLNDIIKNVKKMTQRNKVKIVAHSMGGLVSRRYLQIFGDDDVETLVMVGTPNHGVDGYILSGCSLLGAQAHCEAMDKDSLFLNKLNYGEEPSINVSVIIGTGCPIGGEEGDGIVKNKSAYLSWAKNYYIKGNCSGVNFLHQSMLDTKKHPETYKYIKKELKI